ncbi:MAG: hypothetical protein IPM74_17155 [Crocinitomicaceae bacterium]|nr:hypothetical protein [Crocinitomicaceae bacterium]MBK8927575.1 hypothetical protein [Crocinitomicaceae bacterium]
MNNKLLFTQIVVLIAGLAAACVLHYWLVNTLLLQYFIPQTWIIYLVVTLLTVSTVVVVTYRYAKQKTSAAMAYFVMAFIKMVISVLFLLPWLINKTPLTKPFVLQYIIAFFIALFIELALIANVLNQKSALSVKND